MTTVYVIMASLGEYSDRSTWPVRVYRSRETAQVTMAKLDEIYDRYNKLTRNWQYCRPHQGEVAMSSKQIRAEYEALGLKDIIYDTDWELCEAELIE